MFEKPSLLTRLIVGKSIGFILGVIAFVGAPSFGVEDLKIRVGALLWYVAVGAFVAFAGVFTRHPVLNVSLPWWFMGPWIGGWMNLLLVLIAWNAIEPLMAGGAFFGVSSPWWGVVEGAVVGLIMGGLCTAFGGEGPETTRRLTSSSV